MELRTESKQLMTKLYRDKALDIFVRELRGDLSRLLGLKEPADLPSALHLCLKLENQAFRSFHAMNKGHQTGFRGQPQNPMNMTHTLDKHRLFPQDGIVRSNLPSS